MLHQQWSVEETLEDELGRLAGIHFIGDASRQDEEDKLASRLAQVVLVLIRSRATECFYLNR